MLLTVYIYINCSLAQRQCAIIKNSGEKCALCIIVGQMWIELGLLTLLTDIDKCCCSGG